MRHYNGFLFKATRLENGAFAVSFAGPQRFQTSPLRVLKQQQKHKNLAIIASGPSVKALDFNSLKETDIALVNGAVLLSHQFETESKNTMFLVTDPNFIEKNIENIKTKITPNIKCIFSMRAFYEFVTLDKEFLFKNVSNIFIIDQLHEPYKAYKENLPTLKLKHKINSPYTFDSTTSYGFSLDIEKGIFNGGTVVYSMLQIATYMEYSSIDIYGMDLSDSNRFYHEERPAASRLVTEYESIILPHLILASEVFKKLNIEIVNKSKVSRLPETIFAKDV